MAKHPVFYKLYGRETADIVLRNRTLLWSTPGTFNDPFDCQFNLYFQVETTAAPAVAVVRFSCIVFLVRVFGAKRMDASFILGLAIAIPVGILTNLLTPVVSGWLEARGKKRSLKSKRSELETYELVQSLVQGKRDKYLYVLHWQHLAVMYFLVGVPTSLVGGATATMAILQLQAGGDWLFWTGSVIGGLLSLFGFVLVFFAQVAWGHGDDVIRKLQDFDAYQTAVLARYGPEDEQETP